MKLEEVFANVVRRVVREEIRAALAEQCTAIAPSEWVAIKACGLPPTTRKRLTKSGQLPTAKIGRQLHVRRADVEKYFASRVIATVADGEQDDEFTRALRKKTA